MAHRDAHNEVLLGWGVGSPLPVALSTVLKAAYVARAAAGLLRMVSVQRLLHLGAELQRVCLRLPGEAGAAWPVSVSRCAAGRQMQAA